MRNDTTSPVPAKLTRRNGRIYHIKLITYFVRYWMYCPLFIRQRHNPVNGTWSTLVQVVAWGSYQIRKIAGSHEPGMPGTVSPPPRVSNPDMQHGTCVTHVPWCMPGSLTSRFLWSRRWGKRSRHSRPMRNTQFCVSGKRPMSPVRQAPQQ